MIHRTTKFAVMAALFALAFSSAPARANDAGAVLTTDGGAAAGTVSLVQTPAGVLIEASLENLMPGEHGFHIHGVGACDPDFKAAGGHFNPSGAEHGFHNANGYHAGDLPNIFVGADGRAEVHILNPNVTLGPGTSTLFDADGSSFIVHAKADTYEKNPGAGARAACGVIVSSE